jgi:hypothetical protein
VGNFGAGLATTGSKVGAGCPSRQLITVIGHEYVPGQTFPRPSLRFPQTFKRRDFDVGQF